MKGNRFERVSCYIPFYTAEFFNEGDKPAKIRKVVKIPTKINHEEGDTRSNTTHVEVNRIDFFENDVENVLTVFDTITNRVIKPKGIIDGNEEVKQFVHLLKFVCASTALTTVESMCKKARQDIWTGDVGEHVRNVEQEEVVQDENAFYAMIEGEWEDFPELYIGVDEWRDHLYREYKRIIMNQLHQTMFGAYAYKAFTIQKNYLMNKIIKPYGVSVDQAFRRVDILTNLMREFPPSSKRSRPASAGDWESFNDERDIESDDLQEMKFNLLPPSYQDRFDSLEEDWMEMNEFKFLQEAQKAEAADKKERNSSLEKKIHKKRKNGNRDDDTASTNKKKRTSIEAPKKEEKTRFRRNDRPPRVCDLCKLAGAPEQVYKSHYTNQCKKADAYSKALSRKRDAPKGGEYRKIEEWEDDVWYPKLLSGQSKREAMLFKKVKDLRKQLKKKGKKSDGSVSSMSTDAEF